MPLAVLVAIGDPAGQRLVAAVFAPGLGERFQFDVGRIAVQLAEVLLDRLHLDQRQVQLARAAQLLERGIVQFANRHADQLKLVRAGPYPAGWKSSGPITTCSIESLASTLLHSACS